MAQIHSVSIPVGTIGGTQVVHLMKLPATRGGITIEAAQFVCNAAATSVLTLAYGTGTGNDTTGTAGTLNGTFAAGTAQAFTINTAYVPQGVYLKLGTGAGGALDSGAKLMLQFSWGK